MRETSPHEGSGERDIRGVDEAQEVQESSELLSLAEALADRQVTETQYDMAATAGLEGRAYRTPERMSPVMARAITTGQAHTFLRLRENPDASIDAQDVMVWLPPEAIDELIDFAAEQVPEKARPLFRLPEMRAQIVKAARAEVFRGVQATLSPGSIMERELRKYERLLPECEEVASNHGVTTEAVLRDDELFGEAFRMAHSPAEFVQEQFERGEQGRALIDEMTEKMGSGLRAKGVDERTITQRIEASKQMFDIQLNSQGETPAKQAVRQMREAAHAQARGRFNRIYGEEAAAALPVRLRKWLTNGPPQTH